ncbi:hypothetical protein [Streptomyces sp. NPDC058548]|uniref:hypothetical protein n=1 Tax=Streptomyces sp. NPDC058548 TaxID=3346545 RepID=UPI0036548D9D
MGALDWLKGGNDRQAAASGYAGRESASDAANRKQRAKAQKQRAKDIAKAAHAGQAWEDNDRRRFRA